MIVVVLSSSSSSQSLKYREFLVLGFALLVSLVKPAQISLGKKVVYLSVL